MVFAASTSQLITFHQTPVQTYSPHPGQPSWLLTQWSPSCLSTSICRVHQSADHISPPNTIKNLLTTPMDQCFIKINLCTRLRASKNAMIKKNFLTNLALFPFQSVPFVFVYFSSSSLIYCYIGRSRRIYNFKDQIFYTGWSEQDPNELLDSVVECINQTCSKVYIYPSKTLRKSPILYHAPYFFFFRKCRVQIVNILLG